MHSNKKIIYTAHCVLNQNSVINGWERAQGAFNDVLRVLFDYNIAIIQLPCPEFTFLGEPRPPKTKEEYDILEYRQLCNHLAEDIVKQIKEYKTYNYQIIGLIGIQESPTCDTLGKKGIFMEELEKLLVKENIQLDYFDIPENYMEGKSDETINNLRSFIEKRI